MITFSLKIFLQILKQKVLKLAKQKFYFIKIFLQRKKKFIDLENAKLNELFEDYYDENKPRLYGISSSGDKDKTIVNKGVFTSCNNKGHSRLVYGSKITHDKKGEILYKDTVLKMFDVPVFSKIFHRSFSY